MRVARHLLAAATLLATIGASASGARAEQAVAPAVAPTASSTVSPTVSPTVVPDRPMTFEEKVLAARAAAAEAAKHPAEPRMERSSGFWLGGRKATGGAYYYPLMLVGVCVFALAAFLAVRGFRRIERERRAASPPRA